MYNICVLHPSGDPSWYTFCYFEVFWGFFGPAWYSTNTLKINTKDYYPRSTTLPGTTISVRVVFSYLPLLWNDTSQKSYHYLSCTQNDFPHGHVMLMTSSMLMCKINQLEIRDSLDDHQPRQSISHFQSLTSESVNLYKQLFVYLLGCCCLML